jgi:sirohydrochlorin cobaltochelatase
MNLSDCTLILIGHGSTVHDRSADSVYQHAAELRRRRIFGEVREAFWKQEPFLEKVAPLAGFKRVFFVPFLVSEGYFSEVAIPTRLGFLPEGESQFQRTMERGAQLLTYCKPPGTHSRITELLLARADGVLRDFPFPRAANPAETTLFIVGHGTEQNENSRRSIDAQVPAIAQKGHFAAVHSLFLEEEARVGRWPELAQTRNVAVVPFFMGDGMHVEQDIPVLLGVPARIVAQRLKANQPPWRNPTEKIGKLVWYSKSVGSHEGMPELIVDRVREAAA